MGSGVSHSLDKAQVSLLFEGISPSDLHRLLPILSHNSIKATFAVNPSQILADVSTWRSAADAGHEIANASLYGVTVEGRLPNWTLRMVEQDLHMTQQFLRDMFNIEPATFVLPGLITECAGGDYRKVVRLAFQNVVSAEAGTNLPPIARKNLLGLDGEAWLRGQPGPPDGWSILRLPVTVNDETVKFVSRCGFEIGTVSAFADNLSPLHLAR